MRLYDIKNEILKVLSVQVDEDGCITDDGAEQLEGLELALNEKALNVGKYIKTLEAESKAMKDAVDAINKRKSVVDNNAKRLKEYISNLCNGESFEDPECKISWRKSKSTVVNDVELIPEPYIKTKITKSADLTMIKKALVDGVDIVGCSIVTKNNIQIK